MNYYHDPAGYQLLCQGQPTEFSPRSCWFICSCLIVNGVHFHSRKLSLGETRQLGLIVQPVSSRDQIGTDIYPLSPILSTSPYAPGTLGPQHSLIFKALMMALSGCQAGIYSEDFISRSPETLIRNNCRTQDIRIGQESHHILWLSPRPLPQRGPKETLLMLRGQGQWPA